MIPISLCWDTRKRSILLQWNGFITSGWENGKILTKISGVSVPIPLKRGKIQLPGRLPIRWVYLKGIFSFLTKWRLKKVEGTVSFSDPMINGILYGWMSAFPTGRTDRKTHVTVNFVGENWCRGEATLSLKGLFYQLKKWIFPMIREMMEKRSR